MARVKNKHLATMKMVLAILEARYNQLSAEEKMILRSYQEVVSELDALSGTVAKRNRERMREYRSTPEGYEKSKETRRISAAKVRQRKKEQAQESQEETES